MVDMDIILAMVRGLLSQLLLLNLQLLLSVDMDMDTMDMAMDTMDTMARDLLMPSQDMDIMAVDMAMDMDMDMDMAMDMDTMVKQNLLFFYRVQYTNEVDQRDPVKRN